MSGPKNGLFTHVMHLENKISSLSAFAAGRTFVFLILTLFVIYSTESIPHLQQNVLMVDLTKEHLGKNEKQARFAGLKWIFDYTHLQSTKDYEWQRIAAMRPYLERHDALVCELYRSMPIRRSVPDTDLYIGGMACFNIGDTHVAINLLQRANAGARVLGNCITHFQNDLFEEAEELCKLSTQVNVNGIAEALSYDYLGRTQIRLDMPTDAVHSYLRALNLHSEIEGIQLRLSLAYERSGQLKRAYDLLTREVEKGPVHDNRLYIVLARVQMGLGAYDEARTTLRTAELLADPSLEQQIRTLRALLPE